MGLADRHAVLRVFVVWVVTAVTLFVLSAFVPEIDIPGWGSAFAIAAVIGLLNAVMWPLFVRFALPITVLNQKDLASQPGIDSPTLHPRDLVALGVARPPVSDIKERSANRHPILSLPPVQSCEVRYG